MPIPAPLTAQLAAHNSATSMPVLNFIERLKEHQENPGAFGFRSPSTHYACGYPINPILEVEPWDLDTQICYIESLFLGLPMQTLLVHKQFIDGRGRAEGYSDLIIHGQHELKAIEDFHAGKFSVFGEHTYTGMSWEERGRFHKIPVLIRVLSIDDMDRIDELTIRMVKLSGEHLKK